MQTYASDLHAALHAAGVQVEHWTPMFQTGVWRIPGYVFFACTSILKLRRLNSDVRVHFADGALTLLSPFFRSKRMTATVHGLDLIWEGKWYQWLLCRSLSRCETVVCVSGATRKLAEERGIHSSKLVVIPCGIWNRGPINTQAQGQPVLISVCRLIPRKGIEWFLECVFPDLLSVNNRIQYYIIGNGKRKKVIKKLVQKKGLDAHVQVMGSVTEEEKYQLYLIGRVLVVPNVPVADDMEGFGIVCIEAAERGLSIAAANLEGIPDAVVSGETGMLFSPGNEAECMRVVTQLLDHPLDRQSVRKAALERYDWNVLIQKYLKDVFTDERSHRVAELGSV